MALTEVIHEVITHHESTQIIMNHVTMSVHHLLTMINHQLVSYRPLVDQLFTVNEPVINHQETSH